MLRIVSVSLALAFIVGCGRESRLQNGNSHLSVVQAANGNLYSTKCLRDTDTGRVSQCRVETDAEDARGFHGGQKRFDFSSLIVWDLGGFNPFDVCDFFKNPFLNLNQCAAFFGFPPQLPSLPRPPAYQPRCRVDWFLELYFPGFNQYGCGITWRPYPRSPKPFPVPSPSGGDLLRVKIKDAGADKITYYRLENAIQGSPLQLGGWHRFTRVTCVDGYCSVKALTNIAEWEFQSLKSKALAAKDGTVSDVAPPEIQCLAYSPERTFTANDGATILSVQQDCGGETKKNDAPEAKELVDWLKARIGNFPVLY